MKKSEINYLKYHSQTLENIVVRLSDYLEFRKFLKLYKDDDLFLQLREEFDNLNYNFYDFYKKISKDSKVVDDE
jgi:hypothetical protein